MSANIVDPSRNTCNRRNIARSQTEPTWRDKRTSMKMCGQSWSTGLLVCMLSVSCLPRRYSLRLTWLIVTCPCTTSQSLRFNWWAFLRFWSPQSMRRFTRQQSKTSSVCRIGLSRDRKFCAWNSTFCRLSTLKCSRRARTAFWKGTQR